MSDTVVQIYNADDDLFSIETDHRGLVFAMFDVEGFGGYMSLTKPQALQVAEAIIKFCKDKE